MKRMVSYTNVFNLCVCFSRHHVVGMAHIHPSSRKIKFSPMHMHTCKHARMIKIYFKFNIQTIYQILLHVKDEILMGMPNIH
jgi:hypothetical protein